MILIHIDIGLRESVAAFHHRGKPNGKPSWCIGYAYGRDVRRQESNLRLYFGYREYVFFRHLQAADP
jgi:hypothetical protein